MDYVRFTRSNGHTVSCLSAHLVWSAKYRYHVLKEDIQIRCRLLLVQICEAEDLEILKGVISKNHIHMHIEYHPSQNISYLVKKLKGRTSRKLQEEFPELKKRYWGRHFWGIGYGCWSAGNIADDMLNEYLEHHRRSNDGGNSNFIIEE